MTTQSGTAVPIPVDVIVVGAGMAYLSAAVTAACAMYAKVIAEADEYTWGYVDGLCAAGADVGGIQSGGYIGGLAAALVTGRTAGATVTESTPSSKTTRGKG